ncbi:MAG: IS110 family transposase, partial [Pararhodobacter sp.]
ADRLAAWRDEQVFVVFEATGVYDQTLQRALEAAGIAHARVNPARVRDFARATGRLAKTDAIDAEVLAAFARSLAPPPAETVCEARKALSLLAKRRDQLVAIRAQEKTRRSEAPSPELAHHISRHIAFLDAEIAALEADIRAQIEADPDLSREADLMQSVPGVGPVASLQLIARMPELGHTGPGQLAALAGLAPMNADSGAFRGKRTIKGGRKRVRDALYMAALNAVRKEGPLKTFYQRLRDKGKPAKLALIAVARKLLMILNAIIRDQKPYNPRPAT